MDVGTTATGTASERATHEGTRTAQSMCPLDCPDTCSLEVKIEEGRVVALDGDHRNPLTEGVICGKVRRFAEHVYHGERLLHPLVREGGPKGEPRFRRASWDEALDTIAMRMREVRERSGAEAILPFSYGGSNGKLTQDASDAALFRRLGTARLLQTVCAAPTTAAARSLYGLMPGVAFQDYEAARLIVVWGANPPASGIHLVPWIHRAQEAGAKLVVVDPRRTKLARRADLHLAVRPGTDLVLALAVHRWLFHEGAADAEFLARHTTGAEALRERAEPWTSARAAELAGLEADDVERFARLYAETDPAVIRCGWGQERNRNGGSASAAILALPAVAGKFGQRGGGYTLSNNAAWKLKSPVDDVEPPTRAVNMNRVGRVLCGEEGAPVELLFVYNSNVLATNPDQVRVRRGLEREDLFTVVYDQVMTDTARYADVVLPATTFLEHAELRGGYGTYAMMYAEPVIEPVGEARPNYEVFGELVNRLGLQRPGDDFTARGLARACVDGNEHARAALDGEVVFPESGERPVQFVDVFPLTSDRKAHLFPSELDEAAPLGLYGYTEDPGDERHPLALISPAVARMISSSFGQLYDEEVPLGIHPRDAAARGIADGDPLRVFNDLGSVETTAHVDERLRPGVVELPKGLWARHTRNGLTSNSLVPDTLTDVAGGACFNDARVQVEKQG